MFVPTEFLSFRKLHICSDLFSVDTHKTGHITFTEHVYDLTFVCIPAFVRVTRLGSFSTMDDCVSTFVRVIPTDFFRETLVQFPVVFVAARTGHLRQKMIFS